MWPGYDQRSSPLRRIGCLGVVIAMIVALVVVGGGLGAAPETREDVEKHLDLPILAYARLDDVAYIVFESDGKVYLDRLVLDWISIEWSPTPRWQWSGWWSYIDVTTAPASVAIGDPAGVPVLFGQINDPVIVTLDMEVDGEWQSYPVSGGGVTAPSPEADARPTRYRWLDARGTVIFDVEEASVAGP